MNTNERNELIPIESEKLSVDNIVTRSNPLLSSIEAPLSLGAFKLFDLYLSLINPKDVSSAEVVIRKTDYEHLLNVQRVRDEVLKKKAKELSLLQYGINGENGDLLLLNLFEYVGIYTDKSNGEVLIGMKCSDKAKPLLFNVKTVGYIKYQLKNTFALNTEYEARLYIYLSTQAFRKKWEISYFELKKRLHCEKVKKYDSYGSFNARILSNAIKNINANTNLTVTYQYIFKKGAGAGTGKIRFSVIAKDDTVFLENIPRAETTGSETSVEKEVKEQIGYDKLSGIGNNSVYLELIVAVISEIYNSGSESIKINSMSLPIETVITAYKKLDKTHIQFVIDNLECSSREKKIKNLKNYIMACLYNASALMNAQISTEENYDLNHLQKAVSYDIDELDKINTLSGYNEE